MGDGYTRQSVVDIQPGQDVLASPVNDEFNAIQAAFHGSSGHSHDSSSGEGPKISLTTSISGVLPVANGGYAAIHNIGGGSAPTADDDTGDGYGVGSVWIDTSTNIAYVCLDATSTAAIWQQTSKQNQYAGTVAPTVTNDNTQGYSLGSLWVDGVLQKIYVATNVSTGAAVWKQLEATTGGSPTLDALEALSYVAGDTLYFTAADTPARLAKGTDGQVLTLASGLPSWADLPVSSKIKFTEYTSSGTWTKDDDCLLVYAEVIGGGGGGSSGAKGATLSVGGSGGGGAGQQTGWLKATDLPATLTVTVGAGGAGGLGQTASDTAGLHGTAGGLSSLKDGTTIIMAGGGGGSGNGGTSGGGGGIGTATCSGGNGTAGSGMVDGGAVQGSSASAGNVGSRSGGTLEAGSSGGTGGSNVATGGAGAGSAQAGCGGGGGGGWTGSSYTSAGAGGTRGTINGNGPTGSSNSAGGAGTSATAGTKDGGGGGNGPNAGGNGGVGGGGGGGGGVANTTTSGAGGAGGDGRVRIWEFLIVE